MLAPDAQPIIAAPRAGGLYLVRLVPAAGSPVTRRVVVE